MNEKRDRNNTTVSYQFCIRLHYYKHTYTQLLGKKKISKNFYHSIAFINKTTILFIELSTNNFFFLLFFMVNIT